MKSIKSESDSFRCSPWDFLLLSNQALIAESGDVQETIGLNSNLTH